MPTLTLQPGPVDGQDNTLWSSNPTYNDNFADMTFANYTSRKRAVVKFSLAALPAGAVVTSATLSLYYFQNLIGAITLSTYVHRLTKAWAEATSNWNVADTGDPWATAGGDYDAVADAGPVSIDTTAGEWIDYNITALVQEWVAGTANHGVIFLTDSTGGVNNQRKVYSSDYLTDGTLRPKLVIEYTEPAAGLLLQLQNHGVMNGGAL